MSVNCLVHQNQLIIKEELAVIDDYLAAANVTWRCYGSLAKFANITRENAKDASKTKQRHSVCMQTTI